MLMPKFLNVISFGFKSLGKRLPKRLLKTVEAPLLNRFLSIGRPSPNRRYDSDLLRIRLPKRPRTRIQRHTQDAIQWNLAYGPRKSLNLFRQLAWISVIEPYHYRCFEIG